MRPIAYGVAFMLITVLAIPRVHAQAEICGNGVDDNSNGLTDEGCYPTMTTGVCESPLSCGDTGMVSWSTGSLHYDLPPDLAPAVPYGPGIGFRRFYTSMYTAGTTPSSVNHKPMGPGWQHTYMTWLYPYTDGGGTKRIVLHTSQGRDVFYTDAGACGSYECYSPQAGDHVLKLYVDTTNSLYYIQLLTGETLKYNSSGQLAEIWDTMSPTPNKVLVTWTSTSNGNVSTVTDASNQRRLQFNYTNNLLTSINFQLWQASAWATQVTTTYDYTNGVTRDATSGWFVPANATEWAELLTGTSIPNPTNLFQCQEASGSLSDSIGSTSLALTNNGGDSYSQSVTGWSRKAVKLTDGSTSYWSGSICNPATTACSALTIAEVPESPTSLRELMVTGDIKGARAEVFYSGISATNQAWEQWDDGGLDVTELNYSTSYLNDALIWIIGSNTSGTQLTFASPGGINSSAPSAASGTSSSSNFSLGGHFSASALAYYLYAVVWNGTDLTEAQSQSVALRIENGPGILSKVSIGSQLAQVNSYGTTGYLAEVADGSGNQIIAFKYSSTTNGQVDLISTSRGTVGFEYASSRTACSGDTILYFNKGNTSSCSVDSDCGSGFLCGGKTGTGSTGTCFLAGRCMTTSTVNGESVITAVTPLGPGGGSCTGACTDVMAYNWSSTSNLLNVTGREDPLSNYTSATFNSNGLPTQVGYGDTDGDPTNGGYNRTAWYFYDSTYPGRIAEIRRPSDLSPNASSCSSSSTTGCQRTLFCYGSSCSASCNSDNQLCTVEDDGFTYNSSGSVTTYASKVTYIHDSLGRISEIDGAVSGIKTIFDYFAGGTGQAKDSFLSDYKAYTGTTTYLQPQFTTYDFWGHPTTLKAPDGNYTCDTYDSNRGYLATRKQSLTGSSTCSNTSLTSSWVRDSWLRLTQLTRPDSSMVDYAYDTSGRLSTIKRVDTCLASCVGDYQSFQYTSDSQVSEIDTYNASGTLTAKQPYTYFDSRRLQEVVNPVNTSEFTGLVYDAAGKVTEVDGESSLAKTIYHFDNAPGRDSRVTSEERYKTTSTSDTWSLLYSWLGIQSQVTDPDSKVTGSTRDDKGQLVEISSPDLAGATVRVYDAASNMTTMVEDLGGGGNQETHSFSYDSMNRRLNDDYQGRCSTTGTNHPWIQRSYDSLPSGVTCPTSGSPHMTHACTNTTGRLAYVETVLMCSSTYASTDGSLDQFTWFAYDDAGRIIEEFTTDDTGRRVDTQYAYTNQMLSSVTVPSGGVVNWTYGSSGNNSDADLVTGMSYAPPGSGATTVIDSATWNPFGPWASYNWEATIGGTKLDNRVTRNLAYRITNVYGAEKGSSENAEVDITEDAMGRVTSRVYTPTLTGLSNSYFTYDEQSRVLCEATSSGTCPTSGATLKNNHDLSPPFTGAGDWKEVLRPIAGSSGGTVNNFNTSGTYGTSHQVTDVNQSNGTPSLGHTAFAYDARGNRSYDDNTTTLTNDRRDYTYDARRNVVNVRGQYYSGSAWHYYDVASSFDHKNRRVFKSFYDETTTKIATWFFYYDSLDSLTEAAYTPDTSVSGTYSVFEFVWFGDKLVLSWENDYVASALNASSKRYVVSDETDRPIQLWNWPSAGDATRVWAINPNAWGFDANILGPSVYQPFLFTGQYQDVETAVWENDGTTVHRPGVCVNGSRAYDPFVGGYLGVDALVDQTWSSYVYVDSSPVANVDPDGDRPPPKSPPVFSCGLKVTVINFNNPLGTGPGGLNWEQGASSGLPSCEPPPGKPTGPPPRMEKYPGTFPGDYELGQIESGCFQNWTGDPQSSPGLCNVCLENCAGTELGHCLYLGSRCNIIQILQIEQCRNQRCQGPNGVCPQLTCPTTTPTPAPTTGVTEGS